MGASDSFEVGVVAAVHGLGGALRVRLYDPSSSVIDPGCTVRLRSGEGTVSDFVVRRSAVVPGKPGMFRVELGGVADRDAALALVGRILEIDRAAAAPPSDDEFFLADAVGLPVLRARTEGEPQALGTIIGVTSNGAQDLFDVRYRAADGRTRTWLLPVLPHIIRDVTETAVWVDPPLGLLPDEFDGAHSDGAHSDGEPQ